MEFYNGLLNQKENITVRFFDQLCDIFSGNQSILESLFLYFNAEKSLATNETS